MLGPTRNQHVYGQEHQRTLGPKTEEIGRENDDKPAKTFRTGLADQQEIDGEHHRADHHLIDD